MKIIISVVFTILFIQSLSAQSGSNSKVTVLNLAESFSRQQEVPPSKFVDKVTFVPLENSPKSLIGESLVKYELTDEYIIVRHYTGGIPKIFLFDRKTGKFLREIGKYGRGPGEFARYCELPYNQIKHELYAINFSREILVYDLSGKNIDIIKTPFIPDPQINLLNSSKEQNESAGLMFLMFYDILETDIFVGYFQNFSGFEKRKLILLNKNGILKIFPNYLTWNRGTGPGIMRAPGGFAKFYRWDNKLNFLESFCDTLYQVTKDKLIPRYYFDIGKTYKAEYSKQSEVASKWDQYYYMVKIIENKDHIFFHFVLKREDYLGFIEKRNNEVTICKTNPSDIYPLKDDVSGLMNVEPYCFTHNNEMVYIISPIKLITWLKENPGKAILARDKLPWLKDIDEFSNPVIAIGKCKE